MDSTIYTDPLLEAVEHCANEMNFNFVRAYASDSNPALNRIWIFSRQSDYSSPLEYLFDSHLKDEELFNHLIPFLELERIMAINEFIDDYNTKHPVGSSGIISCCGISPGPDRAIAMLDLRFRILALEDCSGDIESDGKIFQELHTEYLPALTCMDHTIAIDKKGPRTNFKRGFSNGVWQGIISSHSAKCQQVKKMKWLNGLDGKGSLGKRKSEYVKSVFYNADLELETYPDRADALLLARHAVCLYRDSN